jgi:hypothetical protein
MWVKQPIKYVEIEFAKIITILGPLHTRAKSRDLEIVRAQKKVSKGRPNTPPKSWCSVVMESTLKCSVKSYVKILGDTMYWYY